MAPVDAGDKRVWSNGNANIASRNLGDANRRATGGHVLPAAGGDRRAGRHAATVHVLPVAGGDRRAGIQLSAVDAVVSHEVSPLTERWPVLQTRLSGLMMQ